MQHWYVARGTERLGPYTPTQLRDLARRGQLQARDMLLREGSQKWITAVSVKGLFPSQPPRTLPQQSVPPSREVKHELNRAASNLPTGAPSAKKPFLTTLRKAVVILFLAVALTAGWFYWEKTALRIQLQDQEMKIEAERNWLNKLVERLAEEAGEQPQQMDASDPVTLVQQYLFVGKEARSKLKENLAEWKKAEQEAQTVEKLKLRLNALEAVKGPNASIDRYALRAPPEAERSMQNLVDYLVKPALTDKEKFRALFRWPTDRIAYNMPGYREKKYGDNSAEGVFKSRLGVCAGYAALLILL